MRTVMRVAVCGLVMLSASAVQAADRGFYFGAIVSMLTLLLCAVVWPRRIKEPKRIA